MSSERFFVELKMGILRIIDDIGYENHKNIYSRVETKCWQCAQHFAHAQVKNELVLELKQAIR